MNSTQTESPTPPKKRVDATTGDPTYDLDVSDEKVDATTGDPAYDLTVTPGGSSGGAPYDPQMPGSGVDREGGGGGRNGGQPDPDRKGPDRSPDPTEPERQPPPIHEPEPPHDPIREPVEGNHDLGKRSETNPGRR